MLPYKGAMFTEEVRAVAEECVEGLLCEGDAERGSGFVCKKPERRESGLRSKTSYLDRMPCHVAKKGGEVDLKVDLG